MSRTKMEKEEDILTEEEEQEEDLSLLSQSVPSSFVENTKDIGDMERKLLSISSLDEVGFCFMKTGRNKCYVEPARKVTPDLINEEIQRALAKDPKFYKNGVLCAYFIIPTMGQWDLFPSNFHFQSWEEMTQSKEFEKLMLCPDFKKATERAEEMRQQCMERLLPLKEEKKARCSRPPCPSIAFRPGMSLFVESRMGEECWMYHWLVCAIESDETAEGKYRVFLNNGMCLNESDVSFGETLSGYVYKYKEFCEASGTTFKTGRVETHQIVKRVRVREIDLLEYL